MSFADPDPDFSTNLAFLKSRCSGARWTNLGHHRGGRNLDKTWCAHWVVLHSWLGGGFKYLLFHPYLGKNSNLTNIFQLGWNHHLDEVHRIWYSFLVDSEHEHEQFVLGGATRTKSPQGQLMLVVKRVFLGPSNWVQPLCCVFGLCFLVVNWSWQLVWVLVSMKVLRQCLFSSARWWWWSWPIWRPRRLWYKLARHGRKKGLMVHFWECPKGSLNVRSRHAMMWPPIPRFSQWFFEGFYGSWVTPKHVTKSWGVTVRGATPNAWCLQCWSAFFPTVKCTPNKTLSIWKSRQLGNLLAKKWAVKRLGQVCVKKFTYLDNIWSN